MHGSTKGCIDDRWKNEWMDERNKGWGDGCRVVKGGKEGRKEGLSEHRQWKRE